MTTKKDLTVQWILPKKAIIKFQEEADKTYDIDKEVKNLEFIKTGNVISVTIEGDKVTKIESKTETKTVSKTTEKTEEVKKETPKEITKDVEIKNWTIEAITSAKNVVKFKEGDVDWYLVAENIVSEFKDLKKGDIVSIQIGTVEQKGKEKPGVIAITKTTKTPEEEKGQTIQTNNYSPDIKGSSIERQCALKGAVEIVKTLIETDKKIEIEESILKLTKVCYRAIQEA